jgi:NAD(P)-dependent dehydrogenase (short-subunit alcohol dehydrogenase family)
VRSRQASLGSGRSTLGTLYHGTKFAVEGLSEALSWEMEPIGVRVKIIEPGAIKTDFAGRSFDFSNDEGMVEYQPIVKKLLAAIGDLMSTASDPIVVAKAIYEAATDGTNQLRYPAGEDAKVLMDSRKGADDATFIKGVKDRFGLS